MPTRIEQLIAWLLDIQENRCALSGIPFDFGGSDADKALMPSVDRIDSDGHYEDGNLQIVCRFINAWKSDSDDEEFRRLLGSCPMRWCSSAVAKLLASAPLVAL
ncbi:hypothetical protein [Mesorhizobium sp. M0496]|uniref:hypothetical protein n=1 Tax=Mesorhizobium sp. M0496 TaxID=2956952 RepID=UPI003338FA16